MIDRFQGPTRWLSNFEACEIEFEGVVYATTEHAYQAAKSLDPAIREEIRACPTPGRAKRLAQGVQLRPDWEDVKVGVMMFVNTQKYLSRRDLREKLLATGDEELVEGNAWGDRFWGVCDGEGQNMLGKILMTVRDTIREMATVCCCGSMMEDHSAYDNHSPWSMLDDEDGKRLRAQLDRALTG